LVKNGADVSMHPFWRDGGTALRATKRILAIAQQMRRRIHVLHVSTADEVPVLAAHKDVATMECLTHHPHLRRAGMLRAPRDLCADESAVRDARHRDALWQAVRDGVVDCIGSDHAPHTKEEKAKPYPQSPSACPACRLCCRSCSTT